MTAVPVESSPSVGVESSPAPDTSVSTSEPVSTTPAQSTDDGRIRPREGESVRDTIRRAREAAEAKVAAEENKGPEVPKVQEPDKPVEAPKPEEVKPAETKPEEVKPEEDVEKDEFSLEDLAPLPPRELAAKLKADPELDAKLTAAGIKDQVFHNARLASRALEFQKEFPNVETARYARQQAETFGNLDNGFTDIRHLGAEGVDKFMNLLYEMDVIVDDAGKPVLGADGKPQLQGNVQAFVQNFSDIMWESRFPAHMKAIEDQAKAALAANPDDEKANEILAAVEILKAAKPGPAPEELPPGLKAERARIDADKQQLEQTRIAAQEAQYQERENNIGVETDKQINGEIEGILGKTALPKGQFPLIINEIRTMAAERLASNRLFTSQRDWIMRAQWSPAIEKQRIAHNVNSMRDVMYGADRRSGIVAEVLAKYGLKAQEKQAERKATIDTQVKASREPKGTGPVSTPAAQDRGTVVKQIQKEYAEKHGEYPGALYVQQELRKRGIA